MIPQFDKIFRETQDAIVATGKKFKDIPKDSIQSFLKAKGLASSEIGDVYNSLVDFYNPKKADKKSTSSFLDKENTYVEPKDTFKLKEKQPRKTVFSEIKKITK